MKKAKLSADEAVKNTINKDSGMSIAWVLWFIRLFLFSNNSLYSAQIDALLNTSPKLDTDQLPVTPYALFIVVAVTTDSIYWD